MALAGALVGAAGSMGSAAISASAQRDAANKQQQNALASLAQQQNIYAQNVARVDPWVQYGKNQMNTLASRMPELTDRYSMEKYLAGPEYQNIMAQTDRERNNLMAKSSASGMYGSGTMANQLQNNAAYLGQQGYQQGLGNYWGENKSIYDMLNTGSNVGLNAAGQAGNYGNNFANNSAKLYDSMGTAQANAAVGIGNAFSQSAQQLGSLGMGLGAGYQKKWDQEAAIEKAIAAMQGGQSGQTSNYDPWSNQNASKLLYDSVSNPNNFNNFQSTSLFGRMS